MSNPVYCTCEFVDSDGKVVLGDACLIHPLLAPEPIAQRPIVRPAYTDPRGKTFNLWLAENESRVYEYGNKLNLHGSGITTDTFAVIQYETELLRREMKE